MQNTIKINILQITMMSLLGREREKMDLMNVYVVIFLKGKTVIFF